MIMFIVYTLFGNGFDYVHTVHSSFSEWVLLCSYCTLALGIGLIMFVLYTSFGNRFDNVHTLH